MVGPDGLCWDNSSQEATPFATREGCGLNTRIIVGASKNRTLLLLHGTYVQPCYFVDGLIPRLQTAHFAVSHKTRPARNCIVHVMKFCIVFSLRIIVN